jgi:hypothetical protein
MKRCVTTPCDSAKTAQFSAGVSKRGAGFKGRHGDVLTLHEAMVQVLADQGSLRASEIATVINRLKLYTRADGFPVPGSQISARARKCPDLFVRSAGKIGMARVIGPHPTARQKSLPQHRGRKVPTGSALSDLQFWDLGSVKDLIERGIPGDDRLDHCGVYKLIVPPAYVPRFIHPDEAHAARNVIFPWILKRLKSKWALNTDTVYIGVAGRHAPRSLRKRLRDLLRHASGHTNNRGPHKGGEIVWQLRDSLQFHVWAVQTADPPVSRQLEETLLKQFVEAHGTLPFANRQR